MSSVLGYREHAVFWIISKEAAKRQVEHLLDRHKGSVDDEVFESAQASVKTLLIHLAGFKTLSLTE